LPVAPITAALLAQLAGPATVVAILTADVLRATRSPAPVRAR